MIAPQQYIPLRTNESFMVAGQNRLLNTLMGLVGYEPHENYVVFTEDVTQTRATKFVDFQLVVQDFNKYGDYDPLPLPPDMAADVIEEVVKMLIPELPPDKKVDPVSVQNIEQR